MEINLKYQLVARNASVNEAQILRDDLVEDKTAKGGLYNTGFLGAVRHGLGYSYFDAGVQGHSSVLVCKNCLVHALEDHALAGCARALLGQIVDTKYHILGRNGYRTTIRRL